MIWRLCRSSMLVPSVHYWKSLLIGFQFRVSFSERTCFLNFDNELLQFVIAAKHESHSVFLQLLSRSLANILFLWAFKNRSVLLALNTSSADVSWNSKKQAFWLISTFTVSHWLPLRDKLFAWSELVCWHCCQVIRSKVLHIQTGIDLEIFFHEAFHLFEFFMFFHLVKPLNQSAFNVFMSYHLMYLVLHVVKKLKFQDSFFVNGFFSL